MSTVELNAGTRFVASPATSILDAARPQAVMLEYNCRMGRCGVRTAPKLSRATALRRPEANLYPEQLEGGLIPTCWRAAIKDVVLAFEPLDRLAGYEIKTIPCRIVSLDQLTRDIVKVVFKTPRLSPMRFPPGNTSTSSTTARAATAALGVPAETSSPTHSSDQTED